MVAEVDHQKPFDVAAVISYAIKIYLGFQQDNRDDIYIDRRIKSFLEYIEEIVYNESFSLSPSYSKDNIMNQPNISEKSDKQIVIDWLIEHFPLAFFKKGNQIKPLRIGIFEDILEFYDRLDTPPFSKKLLREALNYYSSSPSYLNCQKTDKPRVDLYGNEVDVVTKEQADYANERYKTRYQDK